MLPTATQPRMSGNDGGSETDAPVSMVTKSPESVAGGVSHPAGVKTRLGTAGNAHEPSSGANNISGDDNDEKLRPLHCGVCMFMYDELERRPRNIPCGHTYCSVCVCALLLDGCLTCPTCRTRYAAPHVNHFPVSYTVEAVMKVMRVQQGEAAPQATQESPQLTGEVSQPSEGNTVRKAIPGVSKKIYSMIQEQLVILATKLEEELDQLNQYRAKLSMSGAKHAALLKALNKVVQQHQCVMKLLQEEDVRVKGFVEKGKEIQSDLKAARSHLDQVDTAQGAFFILNTAGYTIVEVEEWLQHTREEMPSGSVTSTSHTIVEATRKAIETIKEETEATCVQAASGHPDCSVMEAVKDYEWKIKFKDLHTDRLKSKVEAGKVFAAHTYEKGTHYSSKMSIEQNIVCLSTLKKESPPPGALTLQVNKVVENLDYPRFIMFLDVTWPERTSPLRVYIKLKGDTPLTRQFVTLCLGHTGLTYCNTKLLRMNNVSRGVILWGGDILGQTPEDGQVLPPIDGDKCGGLVQGKPGMVVARNVSDVTQQTQFEIIVPANCFGYPLYHCIGFINSDVLSTLQTVVRDCRLHPISVVNCGMCVN